MEKIILKKHGGKKKNELSKNRKRSTGEKKGPTLKQKPATTVKKRNLIWGEKGVWGSLKREDRSRKAHSRHAVNQGGVVKKDKREENRPQKERVYTEKTKKNGKTQLGEGCAIRAWGNGGRNGRRGAEPRKKATVCTPVGNRTRRAKRDTRRNRGSTNRGEQRGQVLFDKSKKQTIQTKKTKTKTEGRKKRKKNGRCWVVGERKRQ